MVRCPGRGLQAGAPGVSGISVVLAPISRRARHSVQARRKIQWRSPTAIRLSRDMDADEAVQVQRERLRSLPALRQLPWSCARDEWIIAFELSE